MKTTYPSRLAAEQETQLLQAERDYAYRMMWDEMKYGQFASAQAYAEDYSALASSVVYFMGGE